MKRVLICGGRHYSDSIKILDALSALGGRDGIEVVIHGAASGADTLGELTASQLGIPTLAFPADWERHGKAAGPLRNQKMLDEGRPDIVLAFPDPGSRGTWDMVARARHAGIETKVFNG